MEGVALRQAAWLLGLHLVGLLGAMGWSRRADLTLCQVLAFPLGLVAWVLSTWVLLTLRIPLGAATVGGTLGLLSLVAAYRLYRRPERLDRVARRRLVVGLGAAAGVAVTVSLGSLSVLTHDSHQILSLARVMANQAVPTPHVWHDLRVWSPFVVLLHTAAQYLHLPYLWGLTPTVGASLMASFVFLSYRAIADHEQPLRAVAVILLSLAAMMTSYFMTFQLFYVHANLSTAFFLLLGVALLYLAERQQAPGLLTLGSLMLLAAALHGTEGLLAALVFLALFLVDTTLPRPVLTPRVAAWCGWLALWHLQLYHQGAAAASHGQGRVLATALGLLALPLVWLLTDLPGLVVLRRRGAQLLGLLALALFVGTLVRAPEAMLRSLSVLYGDVRGGFWGRMWQALAAAALLAVLVPRLPMRRLFTHGIVLNLLLVQLLAYGSEPYQEFWGDRGNRLLTHVVPIAFFYFCLKFGRASLGATTPAFALDTSSPSLVPTAPVGAGVARQASG